MELKIVDYLGQAFYAIGDCTKTRENFERALVIKQNYYGRDHSEVARAIQSRKCVGKCGSLIREWQQH